MSEVKFDLPDALAKEARAAGILRSDYVASMLRKEIQRRKINKLFAAADRLSDLEPPFTESDLQFEIQSARRERHES